MPATNITFNQPLTASNMSSGRSSQPPPGKRSLSQTLPQQNPSRNGKRVRTNSTSSQNLQPVQTQVTFAHAPAYSQSPEYEQFPTAMPMSHPMQPQMMPMPIQMHFAPVVPHSTDMANFGSVGPETGSAYAAFQAAGGHSRSVSQASPELRMSPMDAYTYGTTEEFMNGQADPGNGTKKPEDHDQLLRELAKVVCGESLSSLAEKVRLSDNTAGAEKERQAFGMGWLFKHCIRTKEESAAIPRNRVYTHYVTACGDARIKSLNPASFGKLVRIVFPDIKTRRLGVRGHSKYHYCGIKLVNGENGDEENKNPMSTDVKLPILPSNSLAQDSIIHEPTVGEWTSLLQDSDPIGPPAGKDNMTQQINILPILPMTRTEPFIAQPDDIIQELACFLTPAEEERPYGICLPKIAEYVTPGTDSDNVKMLEATYRSHAVQLFESFKVMNMKVFYKLWVQFQGNFTAPVLKILTDPSIANWIEDSDWEIYKEILTLIQACVKTAIPPKVMESFKNVVDGLENHIRENLNTLPSHVVDARARPAAAFCKVLEQALRTNMTCHAAAKILGNDADVLTMESDWRTMVKAERIIRRELPCQHPLAVHMLRDEIVNLVCGKEPQALPYPDDAADENGIFDHWVRWLDRLPARFLGIPARTLLLSVSAVASAAIRDITLGGGEGFGGWWVIVTFVEEYLRWNAERGGFLHRRASGPHKSLTVEIKEASHHHQDVNDDSGISLRDESYDNILAHSEKTHGSHGHPQLGTEISL